MNNFNIRERSRRIIYDYDAMACLITARVFAAYPFRKIVLRQHLFCLWFTHLAHIVFSHGRLQAGRL